MFYRIETKKETRRDFQTPKDPRVILRTADSLRGSPNTSSLWKESPLSTSYAFWLDDSPHYRGFPLDNFQRIVTNRQVLAALLPLCCLPYARSILRGQTQVGGCGNAMWELWELWELWEYPSPNLRSSISYIYIIYSAGLMRGGWFFHWDRHHDCACAVSRGRIGSSDCSSLGVRHDDLQSASREWYPFFTMGHHTAQFNQLPSGKLT